jgi:hypothetical protein
LIEGCPLTRTLLSKILVVMLNSSLFAVTFMTRLTVT